MSPRASSRLEWGLALAVLLAGAIAWLTLRAAADARAIELSRREVQFEHLGTVMNGRSAGARGGPLHALDGLYPGWAVVWVEGGAGLVLGVTASGGRP